MNIFTPMTSAAISTGITAHRRSSFSLFADFDEAVIEARRRPKQPFVPGGARRYNETVRIARVQVDTSRQHIFDRHRLSGAM
jgi:hypothetical protein